MARRVRRLSPAGMIVLLLACSANDSISDSDESFMPWSCTEACPAMETPSVDAGGKPDDHRRDASLLDEFAVRWVRVYQVALTRAVKARRCPMSPSCSNYALQAVAKHGAVVGIVMTVDRLIHEVDEQRYVSRSEDGERFLDPVENNEFLLKPRCAMTSAE